MHCLDWINTTGLYWLVLQPKNIPLPVLFAIINHDRKAGPMLAPAYFLPSVVRGYKIIYLQFKNLWKTFEIPNIYPLYYLMINRNIFDITCTIHNVTSKQNSIHFGTCVIKCFNSLWSSAATWHSLLLILTEDRNGLLDDGTKPLQFQLQSMAFFILDPKMYLQSLSLKW